MKSGHPETSGQGFRVFLGVFMGGDVPTHHPRREDLTVGAPEPHSSTSPPVSQSLTSQEQMEYATFPASLPHTPLPHPSCPRVH
jgi:hypothetical protein